MGYYNTYKGLSIFFLLLWHFSKECFLLRGQIELALYLFHSILMVLHLTCSFKSPIGLVDFGFKKKYLEQGSLETLEFFCQHFLLSSLVKIIFSVALFIKSHV